MWTVGDEAAMVRYLKAGVRNITTRSPLVALRLRAALGTEADACDDFHRHWDAFPGSARLIDREGRILAANAAARQAGFAVRDGADRQWPSGLSDARSLCLRHGAGRCMRGYDALLAAGRWTTGSVGAPVLQVHWRRILIAEGRCL